MDFDVALGYRVERVTGSRAAPVLTGQGRPEGRNGGTLRVPFAPWAGQVRRGRVAGGNAGGAAWVDGQRGRAASCGGSVDQRLCMILLHRHSSGFTTS